jgi:hypothetical protein
MKKRYEIEKMTVSIETITPAHRGFTILGFTQQALQDIHVYFQTSDNDSQSANVRATSDGSGRWAAYISGPFRKGTQITAFARTGRADLACLTQVL